MARDCWSAAMKTALIGTPKADLYRIWRDTLQLMAGRARSDLLWDLGALAPVGRALGGEVTAAEAIGMLHRILHWWP
jgi:hypothetical protein